MSGFYFKFYNRLPRALRIRINPLEEAIRKFVLGAAVKGSQAIIVDAGAGEVPFSGIFADHHYVAVDFARGDPSWDYSNLDVVGDLGNLPFQNDCVGTVINTQVLEHVKKPDFVLKEISRILKPGGKLFLTVPQGWHEHQQPHDFFRFTRFSLDNLLEEAGFSHWEVKPMGGYFHYLGHRLSYLPKILFWKRRGVSRVFLLPLELCCLALFCFGLPLLCYYLDAFDNNKEFTLCYRCRATR